MTTRRARGCESGSALGAAGGRVARTLAGRRNLGAPFVTNTGAGLRLPLSQLVKFHTLLTAMHDQLEAAGLLEAAEAVGSAQSTLEKAVGCAGDRRIPAPFSVGLNGETVHLFRLLELAAKLNQCRLLPVTLGKCSGSSRLQNERATSAAWSPL